jgi:hypothetical protein
MCVELIQKIHDSVGVKCRCHNDDVLFVLCPVTAVRSSHLLPFHPRVGQLFELLIDRYNNNINMHFKMLVHDRRQIAKLLSILTPQRRTDPATVSTRSSTLTLI